MANEQPASWSGRDMRKLRELLMGAEHPWRAIYDHFPSRTERAVAHKARSMGCKNMYYVEQEKRAEERKKCVKPKPPKKPRLPYLTCDRMVSPDTAELCHANGNEVIYA